jgi:hypothetical protein
MFLIANRSWLATLYFFTIVCDIRSYELPPRLSQLWQNYSPEMRFWGMPILQTEMW